MSLLWMFACSDRGFTLVREEPLAPEPDIQVEPLEVAFDPVAVGCVSERPITITNVGRGPLDVESVWVKGFDETVNDYGVESLEGTVLPGETETVFLRFEPSFVWDTAVDLVVTSDDPDEAEVRLPVSGGSFDPTWNLDVFDQAPDAIDVLWVIDNSGSMYQERDRVKREIQEFFQWFEALELDYHMGVITTDVLNPVYAGQLVGTPTFVTRDTPDAQASLGLAITSDGLEMGDEAGLQAMELALSEPLRSGVNEGFYREDARLVVIFLTDEDDQSAPAASEYVRFLEDLKGGREDIFVAAIVGDRDEGCEGECTDGKQEAKGGDKYLDVAEAFSGFDESICTCDLAPAMERMGIESTYYVRTFTLSRTPGEPSMLTVWVNGVEAGGWRYEPAPNAIVFDEAPARGAEIVARYPVEDPCAE